MKKIFFILFTLSISSLLFSQTETEVVRYNHLNKTLISSIETHILLYDSLDTSDEKARKRFVKVIFKSAKPIEKLFSKRTKLSKKHLKKKEGQYFESFENCLELDNSSDYFYESLDQLIFSDDQEFSEWKETSLRSVDKTLNRLIDANSCFTYITKKR